MKNETFIVAAASLLAAAAPCRARVLPQTLVLPQCEFYPLREQDRGYLHRYVDQPLFVDPDLPEDAPSAKFETRRHRFWGEWYSQADWNRAQELGRDSGFDGFAFFPRPHRARYWDAMEKSPVPDFVSVPIAYNRDSDGKDFSQWFGSAVRSTKAYRHGGKALILSYRYANRGSPAELKAKLERMRREHGDMFLFVCDVSKILNPDEAISNGRLSDAMVEKHKALVRDYLRVCDGVIVGDAFSLMHFEEGTRARIFFPSHYEQIVSILKAVVDEPEFRGRKLLGLSSVLAHENHTVQFWTAGEDGLRTLTESMRIACAAEPDVIIMPEWDEFNENTCLCPTLANGFSVKRVMRYFLSGLRHQPLVPLPGDDMSVPNLIVSCRRSVSPGERMVVDVLNIPDGSRTGRLEVSLAVLDAEGRVVESHPAQATDEMSLAHLRFPVDSAALAERTRAARLRVTWRNGNEHGVVEDGLSPVDIVPASGCCLKEIHQPIRDLAPLNGAAKVEFSGGRMKARLACCAPIRYAFVCGNGLIQYVEGDAKSDCMRFREDESNAVFAISGTRPDMLDLKKFRYSVAGASSAEWLDRKGTHLGATFATDWLSSVGDPYYIRIPRADVDNSALTIDFGDVYSGQIPLGVVFRGGVVAVEGKRGAQFSVTRFRRQGRYPSAANRREVSFDVPVDADRPSMMYHVQFVTMDGRTWRSRPFVVESKSAMTAMRVRSAIDGGLRDVRLPAARVPRIAYDFAPTTGANGDMYLPTDDRLLHFATVLGGYYSMATLWNRCSSGSNDLPLGIRPDWKRVESAAPKRVHEPDGTWSLAFDGVDDFVAFPWETVPQNSAYRISFEIFPDSDGGALISSKMLLNVRLEDGIIHASAAGVRDVASAVRVECSKWNKVELVHHGDRFDIVVNGVTASAPAKLPATFMSSLVIGIPAQGSGLKPFKGRIRSLVFRHEQP